MEEYINLYHQKLWEIAFTNVRDTFINQNTLSWGLLIYFSYVMFDLLAGNKKRVLIVTCIPFVLFFLSMGAEYLYSYDKIMNPKSDYNNEWSFEGLKRDTVLPMIENIDKIPIASVDGKLKRQDIILFAVSNPTYYDALFGKPSMLLSRQQKVGDHFLIALIGYKEKNGRWQFVDIRIAPDAEEQDFQKFSKVLHIERGEKVGASSIVSDLQFLYLKNSEEEKNGE